MAKKLRYREIIFMQRKISNKNSIYGGLRKTFGIGLHQSSMLTNKLGFSKTTSLSTFSKTGLKKIESFISLFFTNKVEDDLKTQLRANIDQKKNINCFQGFRHKMRLPVNGQRSRTNAKTQKKNKKTIW